MSDSNEEVLKAGDAVFASEFRCALSSYDDEFSRNVWTLWKHDMTTKFVKYSLKEMTVLEIVEYQLDFSNVMVNMTTLLEMPTERLRYFFHKNSVVPMWEDYENISGCRFTVLMKKENGEAAKTLFINLCNMMVSSQDCPVMEHVNDGLNVLKDKLMQITEGNCRFYCKMNPTFFKKTEVFEIVSETEENIPSETIAASNVFEKMKKLSI
ncbi:hypothetical protein T03_10551 [Trichinella britovi]|uniref:Uncharacterized protein n=1 Tax=Trichinella britovi TaxID=45882 RepID=A0A0V1CEF0_TRIBR|nr:hypothetical protein T03_10551 [Trichinella britovi]